MASPWHLPELQLKGVGKHRIEALTDGVFAVALTLLVLDIKLPDLGANATDGALVSALADLLPKAVSWLVSFFFLSLFWAVQQRLFHYVHRVDRGMQSLGLIFLLGVGFLPFSSSLLGEHAGLPTATIVYSLNLAMLALVIMMQVRHVRRTQDSDVAAIPASVARSLLFRNGGLIACAVAAIILTRFAPAFAGIPYIAMLPIGHWSRRIERSATARH